MISLKQINEIINYINSGPSGAYFPQFMIMTHPLFPNAAELELQFLSCKLQNYVNKMADDWLFAFE